jgi:pimeloyl-ACP methyl ester carboxylesterase
MSRWERISAVAGALLIGGAIVFGMADQPPRSHGTEGTLKTAQCSVPFVNFATANDSTGGTAIIVHGLAANRKIMEPVARWMVAAGLRAYAIDMPGHGESDEPFSFERAEQCAAEFLAELTRRGELDPSRTVFVGHSTGAGIAIRLADRFDAAATIAISPAPLTPQPAPWARVTPFKLPSRLPGNLLVFIASLDPFPIRDSAKEWVTAAGGDDDSDAAFAERRALRLVDVPRATHTSLLMDFRVGVQSVNWVHRALATGRSAKLVPGPPMAYAFALAGVTLVFPAAISLLFGASRVDTLSASAAQAQRLAVWKLYAIWSAAGLLAVVVLRFWIPLRALRLFSGDYLASFLLLVGMLAIVANVNWGPGAPSLRLSQGWDASVRNVLVATPLGLVTLLAASWLLAWQATDVWMNAARWMRFPFVLLAVLPYALAEEWALGTPQPGGRAAARRVLRALALRSILWIVLLAAFLLLDSNQALMPLLALYMLLVSAGQRLGADAIRRRSGSPAAAAIFNAILAAWFIAAVFPLA